MKQLILIFAFLFVATFAKSQSIFTSIHNNFQKDYNLKIINISEVDDSKMKDDYIIFETECLDKSNYQDQLNEIKDEYKLHTIFRTFEYCTWYYTENQTKTKYILIIFFYNLNK
jgi:hypothetical protein